MKRQYAGRMDNLVGTHEGEQGFWPSYADMMSAVALILFFLMLLAYIQNLITGNNLQNTQEALSETQIQLTATQSQLEETRESVAAAQKDLDTVSDKLDEALLTLKERQEEIDTYAKEIAGQETTIAEQQELIDWQKDYMAAADSELREMRSQMQTIAVLRLSILEQIRESIVTVTGDEDAVSIGENGSIVLNEGVLFDLGSSEIKTDSRTMLNKLIDVFADFLSDSDNSQYVDSIVISGHTDITGTAEQNRILSTDRANSVLNYLLTGKNAKLDKYAQYFCAAGYGATRPVESNDTEEGRAANRRIEISIILKDDTVLEIVDQYLEMEIPETDSASASASPAVTPSPTPRVR